MQDPSLALAIQRRFDNVHYGVSIVDPGKWTNRLDKMHVTNEEINVARKQFSNEFKAKAALEALKEQRHIPGPFGNESPDRASTTP